VRRAIMANLERKILPCMGNGFVITSGNTYVFNPLYQVAPGTGSGSRIGRKIQNAFMKIQFYLCFLGENSGGPPPIAETVHVRILHLFSKVVDTAAVASNTFVINPGGLTQGDIFRAITNQGAMYCEVDKNRWTVRRDVVYSISINVGDLPHSKVIRRWNMMLGKKVTYRDDVANSQALQGQHYFVVVGSFCGAVDGTPGTGSRVAEIRPHATIQWTDA